MGETLAGIIGVFVGFLSSYLLLRFNYKQLFAQTVSNNRMDWINVWRENLSIFLANAKILHDMELCTECECYAARLNKTAGCPCEENHKAKLEMLKAKGMITLRLNMTEELHKLMFCAINSLDYKSNKFAAQTEYIEELARQILKPEWERVKNEAKGIK